MRAKDYSMYLLACPCIIDPSLRARGITTEDDIVHFNKCIERCRRFGIDIISMPCPESIFIGKDRDPIDFPSDLDNPAFNRMLDHLHHEVNHLIESRGKPLTMLGVDSSPMCGVDFTYRSGTKEQGKGVFMSRFAGIRQSDVKSFSKYRAYLAAPLFSESERSFNRTIASRLEEILIDLYLPQDSGDDISIRSKDENREIFLKNKKMIDSSDFIVAVIDGADADSGTAWEIGYAYARGIPVLSLRTDFRMVGINESVNLMIEETSLVVKDIDNLCKILAFESGISSSDTINP